MQLKELVAFYHIPAIVEEGIALWRIDSDKCLPREAPVLEVHTMLLMMSGELTVSIHGQQKVLRRGMLIDVMDVRFSLRLLSASPDILALAFLTTGEFLDNLFKYKPPFRESYVYKIKENPINLIDEPETARLYRCMDDIEQILGNTSHHFQGDVLHCRIWIFLMEASDIFICKEEKEHAQLNTRKTDLFHRFLMLLAHNIHKEHSVQFYASQLCVTTQYLGRIVKESTNKTVTQWIDVELYREVSRLILETDKTMQDIAEETGFSDQAVLTKFFKRYTGMTPLQYRNKGRTY
ncbi:MAG: AraC family transcriptional regulator [Bacteroides sp.]|nr:AraC family transcriptional regulator [Bacteroides sp.]